MNYFKLNELIKKYGKKATAKDVMEKEGLCNE